MFNALSARPNTPKLAHTEAEIEVVLLHILEASNIPHQHQVSCEYGRIDVLTDTAIFEVKRAPTNHYLKQAVGQLATYQQAYPHVKKLIMVTTEVAAADISTEMVKKLGVPVLILPTAIDRLTPDHTVNLLQLLQQ